MPPPLSWTKQERNRPVTFSLLRLKLTRLPLPVFTVFEELSLFSYFTQDLAHPGLTLNVARVRLELSGSEKYAIFEMQGLSGLFSMLWNGKEAWVRIWRDSAAMTVVGDTTTKHMLIGQRRWSVHQHRSRPVAFINTAATERPNGCVNDRGMKIVGRAKQTAVWQIYFENILRNISIVSKHNPAGSVGRMYIKRLSGNQWEPERAYPTNGGY